MPEELEQEAISIFEDRLWHHNGREARVIKDEDDDGWALAMAQNGQVEPSLVGPWTMGRENKNPKPLDVSAFNTLVKTAHEVIRRNEQHLATMLRKEIRIVVDGSHVTIALDIESDEDNPSASFPHCSRWPSWVSISAVTPSASCRLPTTRWPSRTAP